MNFLNTKAGAYGVLAVVVLGAGYLIYRKAGQAVSDAAKAVGTAVNPVSDKNLAYSGVNAVGAALSGDQSWSLGSWLYDVTHAEYDPNKPVQRAAQIKSNATRLIDYLRGE